MPRKVQYSANDLLYQTIGSTTMMCCEQSQNLPNPLVIIPDNDAHTFGVL